ncbi:MAG TPA: hypothetical protein VIX12_02590, partial [Candidatus Binataceae bacterium]
ASAVILETRLNDLLQASNELRGTLRRVRLSAVARDSHVEECTSMGFRTLVEAEKLSSEVETILYARSDLSRADTHQLKVRSDGHSVPPPVPER